MKKLFESIKLFLSQHRLASIIVLGAFLIVSFSVLSFSAGF